MEVENDMSNKAACREKLCTVASMYIQSTTSQMLQATNFHTS